MKMLHSPKISTLVLYTFLNGCAITGQPPSDVVEAVPGDPNCVVTQAAFIHIRDRHCAQNPLPGVNQLLPQYCVSAQTAQQLCEMIQHAPNQNRNVQGDGRIRYDSNLGVAIGTAGETCGRLVITSINNGVVVTEFPEFQGAPGNCH